MKRNLIVLASDDLGQENTACFGHQSFVMLGPDKLNQEYNLNAHLSGQICSSEGQ